MRLKRALWMLLLTLAVAFPAAVGADPPAATTLLAGARVEYRFDYRGDNTPITIAVDAPGATLVNLWIYTPGQIELTRKGQPQDPIGRGTHGREHDLFWTGKFNAPGAYLVVVENRSPGPITYQLSIEGDSVSGVGQVVPATPPAASILSGQSGPRTLTLNLPPGAGPSPLRLTLPGPPGDCLHANQVPAVLAWSAKLCPNEIYPPLHLVGNNLALYADDAHTAVVNSAGRQFAVVLEGSNNLIEAITVQASADPADAGAFLCLYEDCTFPTQPQPTRITGGIAYGGGILVRGSFNTVHGVTVRGGTIGIATSGGRSNYILDNQLNDLNGWGSFNLNSVASYFVGNTWNRENHACTTPDGYKFLHGCETASWVCLACTGNIVARNHCALSGNCYYLSGERGLASHDNKLVANYCAGASDNCFEITFARGNILQDNVATADPSTGAPCKYPFWIGGSTVYVKNNQWQCSIGEQDALDQARQSTSLPTNALSLDGATPSATPGVSPAPARTATPLPAATPAATPSTPAAVCPEDRCETITP